MSQITHMSPDSKSGDVEKRSAESTSSPNGATPSTEYPGMKAVLLIMTSLYLSIFLVALDQTIIGTAIPRITDDFHSLGDVGWYGSAYLLTSCAFQLLFGRIYTYYSPKYVFLTAIGLLEAGSTVCGAAPNSIAFIIGRAIAGLGSSGIISGVIIIIVHTVPLPKRPMYQGFVGAIFGLASVSGPLLGGAFTQNVSWRWCFFINLPIGAVTFVILVFILHPPTAGTVNTPIRQKIAQLDPLGSLFFLPSVVCLLLALQWGGTTYAWKDGRIIALLSVSVVLMVCFIAIQVARPDTATVPPRIIKQRSIVAGICFSICNGGSLLVLVYYLPIWFQAIQGVSAVESGIRNLPVVLSLVVASISAGILVTKMGYYTPFMIFSSIVTSIGTGLITTFQIDSGPRIWIGYQVLYGLGLGFGMQQAGIAAQVVLPKQDVPTGVSLMFFGRSLGGAVFISVAQNVFANKLVQGLANVSGLAPNVIVTTGATQLRSVVPPDKLSIVIAVYNLALVNAFEVALAVACLSIIASLAVEWKSVKGRQGPSGPPGGYSGPDVPGGKPS